ncbi:MAG: FtsX-like permease family protein [Acetivibrio ethanolgignens]
MEKQYGAWSGAVYNADVEICDFLKESNDVKKFGEISTLRDLVIFQDDFSAYIGTIDEGAFELGKIDMLEGSLPSQEEEIVLDKYLLKQIAPDAKVGDTVSIPLQEMREGSGRSYEFVLSGVMNQWQENWNKANYPLPSAFVNEKNDLSQNIEEITNCFFLGKEENNYAVSHLDELLKAREDSTYVYNQNTYAMSFEVENQFFEQKTFIAMICAFSILVIGFLMSMIVGGMKYRITIMRSLGADKKTVYSIFMWEAFYLWRKGMLLGIGAGIFCSAVIIGVVKFVLRINIMISVRWIDLVLALALFSVVFLLGYFLITLDSVFSRMRTSYREDNSSVINQKLPLPKKIKPMTVSRLYGRFFRFYSKRSLLKIAVSILAVLILNLNALLFLKHYDRYQEIEIDYNYSLTIFDVDKCLDLSQIERLKEITGILSVEAEKELFSNDDMIYVTWEGWIKSQYINTLRKYDYASALSEDKDKKESDTYCLNSITGLKADDTALVDWYENCIDEGALNREKFADGEQCVLFLSPFFLEPSEMVDKKYEVQPLINAAIYDKVSKVYEYENDESSIKPGDMITVQVGKDSKQIEVGGIIRSVTGLPPAPLNGPYGSGALVVSEEFIEKLAEIPPSKYNILEIESYVNADHGETDWQVTNLIETFLGTDDGNSYLLENHHEFSEIVMKMEMAEMVKAVFIIVITVLVLGFILYQGTVGKLQNEGKRIQILHDLGMSKRRIYSMYWLETTIEGLCAGILGVAIVAVIQFLIWKKESGYTKFMAILDAGISAAPANAYLAYIYLTVLALYFILLFTVY